MGALTRRRMAKPAGFAGLVAAVDKSAKPGLWSSWQGTRLGARVAQSGQDEASRVFDDITRDGAESLDQQLLNYFLVDYGLSEHDSTLLFEMMDELGTGIIE